MMIIVSLLINRQITYFEDIIRSGFIKIKNKLSITDITNIYIIQGCPIVL